MRSEMRTNPYIVLCVDEYLVLTTNFVVFCKTSVLIYNNWYCECSDTQGRLFNHLLLLSLTLSVVLMLSRWN